jgi:hypothetical protein
MWKTPLSRRIQGRHGTFEYVTGGRCQFRQDLGTNPCLDQHRGLAPLLGCLAVFVA